MNKYVEEKLEHVRRLFNAIFHGYVLTVEPLRHDYIVRFKVNDYYRMGLSLEMVQELSEYDILKNLANNFINYLIDEIFKEKRY